MRIYDFFAKCWLQQLFNIRKKMHKNIQYDREVDSNENGNETQVTYLIHSVARIVNKHTAVLLPINEYFPYNPIYFYISTFPQCVSVAYEV